jgi:hypothetical protein
MIADKTDQELVADAQMLAAELSKVREALERRGIESDLLSYEGGRVEVKNFERVTREKL